MISRNKRKSAVCSLLLAALCLTAAGLAFGAPEMKVVRVERDFDVVEPDRFVEDEFIVVLTAATRNGFQAAVDPASRPTVNLPSLQEAIDLHDVTRFARQFEAAQPQPAGSKFHDLTGHYKVKIEAGVSLDQAMEAFRRDPGVDHVEKIGIHPVHSCATGTPNTPNDTYFDNPPVSFEWPQWDLWDANGIDADLAWDTETGSSAVVVADLDSGFRYFHGDLGGSDPPGPNDTTTNGNIWINTFETPGNGVDDEGNGKVDDVIGWDFVSNPTQCHSSEDCSTPDNDPRDFNGHGTHTGGTIAAITNNAAGVAGVAGGFSNGTFNSTANGVKLMTLRIGWSNALHQGFVRMDWAAEAMNYVTDMKNRGVNVAAVNASWGTSNSGGLNAAVDNLLAADVMLIHSAGNSGSSTADFLGTKSGVIDVAATDKNGNRASFSNFGSWVEMAAPGVDIISTWHVWDDPGGDYVSILDGTSMSAPHVAGVAGLLESCDPSLTRQQKYNILVNNTCTAGSSNIGGILNARLALDAAGCSGGCTTNGDCDDGDACNGLETCDIPSGTCQSGTPVNCDDSNACTDDSCDPGSGACSNDPINCDDGLFCNGSESCDTGSGCQAGSDPCPDQGCDEANDVCSTCDNDGTCEAGEDCNNCSNDCISGGGAASCGNGVCEPGEDCTNCSDCRGKQNGKFSNRFCCGGAGGDNPVDCSDNRCTSDGFQCSTTTSSYCCGDGNCEGAEDSISCVIDCPGAVCGDGTCDAGEDGCSCSADCIAPPNETDFCDDNQDNDCDLLIDCNDAADCGTDPACTCGGNGASCSINGDCCSNKCRRGSCKGN